MGLWCSGMYMPFEIFTRQASYYSHRLHKLCESSVYHRVTLMVEHTEGTGNMVI